MLNLETIHKPKTLDEALARLQERDTVVMAGGTTLLSEKRRDVRAVIDLSALGLDYLETRAGDVVMGAMSTLARVTDSAVLREQADGTLSHAAHGAHASILRNQVTVGGTVISEPDGIFSVALSALDARVVLATLIDGHAESTDLTLADFFSQRTSLRGRILTALVIPAASLQRRSVLETVGRTPRDKAIVSVCAALEIERGVVRAGAIALGGVARTAWRARDAEREVLNRGLTNDVMDRAAMAATSALNPAGDFRGSSAYRIEMARVLTARALRALQGK